MYIVLKPHISVFQFFFIVDFWHQKVFGNYHYKNTVDVFTYKSQWYSLSHVIVFYHFLLIFLRYLHITVNEKPLNQYMANILRFFSFTRSLLIPEKIHRNKSTLLKRFYNGKKKWHLLSNRNFSGLLTQFFKIIIRVLCNAKSS